jgi:hypothetical protein
MTRKLPYALKADKPLDLAEFDLKPVASKKRKRSFKRNSNKGESGVYFVESGASDLVKIGVSGGVSCRMAEIGKSKGAPAGPYMIWGMVYCARTDGVRLEAALHQAFATYRSDGEWFNLRGKDIAEMVIGIAQEVCSGPFRLGGLSLNQDPIDKEKWQRNDDTRWQSRSSAGKPKHYWFF